jgi:hypothetical protein
VSKIDDANSWSNYFFANANRIKLLIAKRMHQIEIQKYEHILKPHATIEISKMKTLSLSSHKMLDQESQAWHIDHEHQTEDVPKITSNQL